MARTDDNENFTDEERQAMKDRAKETRTARSRKKKTPEEARAEGEAELRAKLDELTGSDREENEQVNDFVKTHDLYGTAGIHPHASDGAEDRGVLAQD